MSGHATSERHYGSGAVPPAPCPTAMEANKNATEYALRRAKRAPGLTASIMSTPAATVEKARFVRVVAGVGHVTASNGPDSVMRANGGKHNSTRS